MDKESSQTGTYIVLAVIAAIFLMHVKSAYVEVDYVVSTIDNRRYLVQNLPDKRDAVRLLSRVNRRLERLVARMKARYPDDAEVQFMAHNYNPDNVSEGSQQDGYTSYSVGKGEKIVLCIRTDDRLERMNTIMYVAIHELAHVMTREYGHTPGFWSNFERLLDEAVAAGLYRKEDYASKPQPYCGIEINSSVLYN
jgi:hypothetical protein